MAAQSADANERGAIRRFAADPGRIRVTNMKAKKCPICGKLSLQQKRGDYQMELPPNISGNTVVVADAEWQHCDSCGEDILSKELEQAINRKCRRRKQSPVS